MTNIYRLKKTLLVWFLSIGLTLFLSTQASGQVIHISVNQLMDYLYHPQFLILDVRTSANWQASDKKIKGALRKKPKAFDSWSNELPKNKILVLY